MTRKTDKRKWRILYPLFFALFSSILLFTILHKGSPAAKVKVRTYQVKEGWGYQIIVKDKILIDQPFIPVIQGRRAFPDKKTARMTGKRVKQKLLDHQMPTLTREDLKELGLDSLEKAK